VGTGTSFDPNCGAVAASGATTRYPCFLIVKDTNTNTSWPYEVSSCADTTHCTLALQYIGASQGAAAYSLHKGGVLFWHDPGPNVSNGNQYSNYFVVNTQSVWMTHYLASTTSGGIVNSRINFWGGWNNMAGVGQDSIFAYCGHFCDTMNFIGVAVNGHAFGVVFADAHQNTVLAARFENTSPPSVPTYGDCTGSGYPCTKGVVVMADNASDTYGNQIALNYFRQVGNGIEFSGVSGQTPTQSRIFGNTFRTNAAACVGVFSVATNTYGECDGDGGFKTLQVGGVNVFPPAGIPNWTGSGWGTSYNTSGTGNTLALSSNPVFTGNVTLPGTGIWNSSGNVGIGKTSPAGNLDVLGTVIAETSLAVGRTTACAGGVMFCTSAATGTPGNTVSIDSTGLLNANGGINITTAQGFVTNGPVYANEFFSNTNLIFHNSGSPVTGAPSSACFFGDVYLNLSGGTTTTLYVCTAASVWTAK
jgi:hypothetical protein